jgi:hypothetical protein
MIVMNITEARERAKPRGTPRILRPRVRIEEPLVKKKRRSPAKKKQRLFAMLPKFFIKKPATFGMSVLETAITVALVRLATAAQFQHERKLALDHAARLHSNAPDGQMKRDRMSQTYHRKLEELKARPATEVTLDTNRFALLKAAYVSSGTPNCNRVTDALDHFLVIKGGPLEWYQEFKDGTLRCCVSSEWLKPNDWRRIPVPLPTRSLPAINLAMFLRCTSGKKVYGIKVATLSANIGIVSKTQFAQRQAISRARKQVNNATWMHIVGAVKADWEEPDHFFYEEEFEGDIVRFKRSRSWPRDAKGRAM